ncbi:hypothetical protein SAMN04487965_1958 [Microbulbifer donghaiensis]|uniref:SnoaL-like domain-containing protein n=1 Tax=Microbulbifer donghaiensis TaxID=494016 RepID=A0A1M5ATA8_9GAMM|nr:hypothetical protein [Microbulbifer donghaiensis]SHF33182.1 hypothetical protein SAMN04487965_1958 [Microbulbifer donghaiensis]
MHKARLEDINKLFLEYRRQFEIGDAEQVADFYRFPLHYYREDGSKLTVTRQEFVQQVDKLLNAYRRLQVSQIVGTVTDVIELNDNSSLATLNWILLYPQGDKSAELYSSTTRYLVTDTEGGLKIDGLILVDESVKIRGAVRARKGSAKGSAR